MYHRYIEIEVHTKSYTTMGRTSIRQHLHHVLERRNVKLRARTQDIGRVDALKQITPSLINSTDKSLPNSFTTDDTYGVQKMCTHHGLRIKLHDAFGSSIICFVNLFWVTGFHFSWLRYTLNNTPCSSLFCCLKLNAR